MSDRIAILVVEDEVLIRELLLVTLEDAGYAVASACDGAEALAMIEADDASFDALLTDINLSGRAVEGPSVDNRPVDGWRVARRAREIDGDLPVVYMTGGNAHEWAANGVPNSLLVLKPFATAQIVTALSQLINAAQMARAQAPALEGSK